MGNLKDRLIKIAEEDLQNAIQDNQEQVVQEQGQQDEQKQIAMDILNRILQSGEDIKDAYYSLLDNLNALNRDYQGIYNEFKMMVKLPDKKEVNNVAQLQLDISEAVKYLSDPNFIENFLKGKK